ncbi:uncharacterized protein LOC111324028 [Stylophora pistillata]|uniref:uncharacterized protein LOC111324028 n=1 Tax=Stylophora pistillata TaxID=50429 RepID=UPI000C04E21C|nr:uncharacterized protein LOC111324028 [Stylophora pistillata]
MVVLVRTFGRRFSLRRGVRIVGIWGLIYSAYAIYQGIHLIRLFKKVEEDADEISQYLPFREKYLLAIVPLNYANLAARVVSVLVDLLLLGSSFSGDRRLAFPWLGWSIFDLCFTLGVMVFFISIWKGFAAFLLVFSSEWLLSISRLDYFEFRFY